MVDKSKLEIARLRGGLNFYRLALVVLVLLGIFIEYKALEMIWELRDELHVTVEYYNAEMHRLEQQLLECDSVRDDVGPREDE